MKTSLPNFAENQRAGNFQPCFLFQKSFCGFFYFFIILNPLYSFIPLEPCHLSLGIIFFDLDHFFEKLVKKCSTTNGTIIINT